MAVIKYMLFCLLVLSLISSYFLAYVPLIIPLTLFLVSIITFLVYARDKYAAIHDEWRISENTLHAFSLFGGWPEAIIAQQSLHHKNRKISFQITFWFVMLTNSALLVWLHTNQGNSKLHGFITALENLIARELAANKFSNVLLYLLQYSSSI